MGEVDDTTAIHRPLDSRIPAWPVSLLWPQPAAQRAPVHLDVAGITDLSLERIVQALDPDHQHARVIRAILCELPADPDVIAYRQEILADFLTTPALAAALEPMLPELAALGNAGGSSWPGDSLLMPVMTRLRQLDRYVAVVDKLQALLADAGAFASRGLKALRAGIAALASDPDVVALRTELPALHDLIGEAKSVTIGLNLDADLEPEAATIVELNAYQFKGARSLLGRLLPNSAAGITSAGALHHAGPKSLRRDSELYRDLQRLLESVAAPLGRALGRYRDIHAGPLVSLEGELAFFIGGAALVKRLQQAGLPFCRPAIAPRAERLFAIDESFNLSLALQMLDDSTVPFDGRLVRNDAVLDAHGRIAIITGPNRGGKTTYCRALGQAQVLFQTGLYIPGSSAKLSPVDGIWTHFPLPEVDRPGAGRLDEEIRRLRQIFGEATAASLILLNEPLTSTSERDALAIATDLVQGLQILGARSVIVTHLHNLATAIPELNAAEAGIGAIRSLVAETLGEGESVVGTFRIRAGLPTGRSYAAEIARQHGLTLSQLRALLADRAKRDGQMPMGEG